MLVRWDRVPTEFHYLRDAVEACGETRVTHFDSAVGCHVPFIETVSEQQLYLIRSAKDEVARREDRPHIEEWFKNNFQARPQVRNAIWHIQGMLFLFGQLEGKQGSVFDDDSIDD